MVTHIMRGGEVLRDIAGHKVKRSDVPRAYDIKDQIKERVTDDRGAKETTEHRKH